MSENGLSPSNSRVRGKSSQSRKTPRASSPENKNNSRTERKTDHPKRKLKRLNTARTRTEESAGPSRLHRTRTSLSIEEEHWTAGITTEDPFDLLHEEFKLRVFENENTLKATLRTADLFEGFDKLIESTKLTPSTEQYQNFVVELQRWMTQNPVQVPAGASIPRLNFVQFMHVVNAWYLSSRPGFARIRPIENVRTHGYLLLMITVVRDYAAVRALLEQKGEQVTSIDEKLNEYGELVQKLLVGAKDALSLEGLGLSVKMLDRELREVLGHLGKLRGESSLSEAHSFYKKQLQILREQAKDNRKKEKKKKEEKKSEEKKKEEKKSTETQEKPSIKMNPFLLLSKIIMNLKKLNATQDMTKNILESRVAILKLWKEGADTHCFVSGLDLNKEGLNEDFSAERVKKDINLLENLRDLERELRKNSDNEEAKEQLSAARDEAAQFWYEEPPKGLTKELETIEERDEDMEKSHELSTIKTHIKHPPSTATTETQTLLIEPPAEAPATVLTATIETQTPSAPPTVQITLENRAQDSFTVTSKKTQSQLTTQYEPNSIVHLKSRPVSTATYSPNLCVTSTGFEQILSRHHFLADKATEVDTPVRRSQATVTDIELLDPPPVEPIQAARRPERTVTQVHNPLQYYHVRNPTDPNLNPPAQQGIRFPEQVPSPNIPPRSMFMSPNLQSPHSFMAPQRTSQLLPQYQQYPMFRSSQGQYTSPMLSNPMLNRNHSLQGHGNGHYHFPQRRAPQRRAPSQCSESSCSDIISIEHSSDSGKDYPIVQYKRGADYKVKHVNPAVFDSLTPSLKKKNRKQYRKTPRQRKTDIKRKFSNKYSSGSSDSSSDSSESSERSYEKPIFNYSEANMSRHRRPMKVHSAVPELPETSVKTINLLAPHNNQKLNVNIRKLIETTDSHTPGRLSQEFISPQFNKLLPNRSLARHNTLIVESQPSPRSSELLPPMSKPQLPEVFTTLFSKYSSNTRTMPAASFIQFCRDFHFSAPNTTQELSLEQFILIVQKLQIPLEALAAVAFKQ